MTTDRDKIETCGDVNPHSANGNTCTRPNGHPGHHATAAAFWPPVVNRVAARRPWRRCSACADVCHWHDTAWVCDGCGSEWDRDHDTKYDAPGGA